MDFFASWNFSAFLFNIVCSVIASFIFVYLLLIILKPKFRLIPIIARQDSPFDDVPDICYAFKIVNKSLFGAYDVEARANFYTLRMGENGIYHRIFHKIELKTSKINYVPRRKLFKKNYGDNCIQFFTYENLLDEVKDNKKYVQLQVTARHGLSGLSNIFTYDFIDNSFIKNGMFCAGDTDRIKEVN